MCQFAPVSLRLWLCHPLVSFCQMYSGSSPIIRSPKSVAALCFHSICPPRATASPSSKSLTSSLPMPSQIENSGKEKVSHTENVTFIKIDRLEKDLLFKTEAIRVALPLQAQASVTLLEEIESGCGDIKPGHGRASPHSQYRKGFHSWFAAHPTCCTSNRHSLERLAALCNLAK